MLSTLPQSFWSEFVDEYWNRRPGVFKQVLSQPLLSSEEMVAGIKFAQKNQKGEGFRLFADQRMAQSPDDVAKFSAQKATTLDELAATIGTALGGKRFGIIIDGAPFARMLHNYLPEVLSRLQTFIKPLTDIVGIPPMEIGSTAFVGNYEKTVFGIHIDATHVLVSPIQGSKTMLFWPEDYFRRKNVHFVAHKPIGDVKAYAADAITLTAEPGDLLYLPPPYWHIGYSKSPELSASINIRLPIQQSLIPVFSGMLEQLLTRQLGGDFQFQSWSRERPDRLPADYAVVVDALQTIVASEEFRQMIEAHACRRFDNNGWPAFASFQKQK